MVVFFGVLLVRGFVRVLATAIGYVPSEQIPNPIWFPSIVYPCFCFVIGRLSFSCGLAEVEVQIRFWKGWAEWRVLMAGTKDLRWSFLVSLKDRNLLKYLLQIVKSLESAAGWHSFLGALGNRSRCRLPISVSHRKSVCLRNRIAQSLAQGGVVFGDGLWWIECSYQ